MHDQQHDPHDTEPAPAPPRLTLTEMQIHQAGEILDSLRGELTRLRANLYADHAEGTEDSLAAMRAGIRRLESLGATIGVRPVETDLDQLELCATPGEPAGSEALAIPTMPAPEGLDVWRLVGSLHGTKIWARFTEPPTRRVPPR